MTGPALRWGALACTGGVIIGVLATAWTSALPVGVALGSVVALAIGSRWTAQRRALLARWESSWAPVIDDLAASVSAGLSLGDALVLAARRAEAPLNIPMSLAAREYRVTGRLDAALTTLTAALPQAGPATGRRVASALTVASHVGGSDLGRLLRALSSSVREDQRVRQEIAARQAWTLNAARLGVAAPWLVLIVVCLQPTSAAAYRGLPGALVLALVGLTSGAAYLAMRALTAPVRGAG
ncbi:MAG: type II secretion system F family protein [Actinomycetales bacterium]|nr:type II secretion system F family protein [Actinomycetales bacterium]